MPQGKRAGEFQSGQPEILRHVSGERPYNRGIYLNSCPSCGKDLPASRKKQLELGYRVYCPTEGCFYPLFTYTTLQQGALEPIEPPKVREKLPDASKAPQIREKVPKPSKPAKPAQGAVPPKSTTAPKPADLRYCPRCKHPLTSSQLKLKQTGKKVMCRNCLELI